MAKRLRSADRFDRKLASLFEELPGREKELQSRLDELVKALLDGTVTQAQQHHATDGTCCLPLIDNFVIIFEPDQWGLASPSSSNGPAMIDFANAGRFDLLNIEQEPERRK